MTGLKDTDFPATLPETEQDEFGEHICEEYKIRVQGEIPIYYPESKTIKWNKIGREQIFGVIPPCNYEHSHDIFAYFSNVKTGEPIAYYQSVTGLRHNDTRLEFRHENKIYGVTYMDGKFLYVKELKDFTFPFIGGLNLHFLHPTIMKSCTCKDGY